MTPYEIFNEKMYEFIDDIVTSFPSEVEFQTFRTMLDMSVAFSVKLPQEMFNTCVAIPYESEILNENEIFFLRETYDPQYTDINIVNKLKALWKQLDAKEKQFIWKYMKVLVVLNKRCLDS